MIDSTYLTKHPRYYYYTSHDSQNPFLLARDGSSEAVMLPVIETVKACHLETGQSVDPRRAPTKAQRTMAALSR